MSTEQPQKPFGNTTAGSITPLRRLASRTIAGPQYEEPVRGQKGQDHLSSLQRLVCELLIKNQELRLALESTMAQEKEERSWRPIR
jgi:hypothetical protein